MADYKSYLAASILTEDKVVTYRLLSRVLKVHVNAAKEMLYDFHRVQNAKKPGTIHATYLIAGTKRKQAPIAVEVEKDGEDYYMQSSPFVGSSMPQSDGSAGQGSILSIILTREEDLETIRSQFEHISSIHIYSLGPHPLKELQLLSDSTREIQTLLKSEDPLESYHKYGIITNPNAKRRTRKAPPIAANIPIAVPTRPAATKSKLNEVQEPSKSSSSSSSKKPEPKSQPSNAKDFFGNKGKEKTKINTQPDSTKAEPATAPSSKESTPAPPANLKRESSSIFKAFAKSQPKKAKIEETDSNPKEEDTPMKDASDDDDEDTWMPAPASKETKANDWKSRKETQESLRKMMEDDEEDGEEEEAAPSPAPETPIEEPEEEKAPEEAKEEEPVTTTSNGRRRGRRRVLKKKTVKDEDGYLVTKQEQAWESFSEDEPLPAPKARALVPTTSKVKKEASKKGQGSIMSFFGKK